MSRFSFNFPIFLISLLFLVSSFSTQAQEVEEALPTIIITPMPEPKEVVVEPQGYISCTTVGAGWYQNEWHPERRICRYAPSQSSQESAIKGEAWIESHWACSQYKIVENMKAECLKWEWKAGHWGTSLDQY